MNSFKNTFLNKQTRLNSFVIRYEDILIFFPIKHVSMNMPHVLPQDMFAVSVGIILREVASLVIMDLLRGKFFSFRIDPFSERAHLRGNSQSQKFLSLKK